MALLYPISFCQLSGLVSYLPYRKEIDRNSTREIRNNKLKIKDINITMTKENKEQLTDPAQQQEPTQLTDCQSTEANEAEASEAPQTPTAEEELTKLQDAHLRLMAEYDNFRKRTLREKSELIRNGGEKVLLELLPVIDDLDIALQNIERTDDLVALREGIKLIHSKFVDYLQRQGVKEIETIEATFDEERHEAIAVIPAPSEEFKGKVVDCVKKGYTLNDKVIRHANVVVGQ